MSENYNPIRGDWSGGDEFSLPQPVDKLLKFGNKFLDSALRGIFPDDLILLGAPTGSGKTQFAVNMALENAKKGYRVNFIALEASKNEVQNRLAFSNFANVFYDDPFRVKLGKPLNYQDFMLGEFNWLYEKYKTKVDYELMNCKNLQVHYGGEDFSVDDLIKKCVAIENETDLVVVDHVHYFDYGSEDTENIALKKIVKAARRLTQELQKPMVLIAHLRKRDKFNNEICPSIDEFHGSSDLTKIATRVITLARYKQKNDTSGSTLFRILKNRMDGGVCYYAASQIYRVELGNYEQQMKIGEISENGESFNEINKSDPKFPYWLK